MHRKKGVGIQPTTSTRERGRLRQGIPLIEGQPVDPAKPVDAEKLLREIREIKETGRAVYIERRYG